MPCRINRASVWATRIELESLLHGDSVFVTLTYSDPEYPADEGTATQRKHVQLFLKALRKRLPQKVRYFIAAEFGSRTRRLHYHGVLFGVSRFDQAAIEQAWRRGFIQIGECNAKTCRYVSKYVCKGDSRSEVDSGKPTRAFMSRRPGIGARVFECLPKAASFRRSVSGYLRVGKDTRPLGRYLARKLGAAIGLTAAELQGGRLGRVAELVGRIERDGISEWRAAEGRVALNSSREAAARFRQSSLKEKL